MSEGSSSDKILERVRVVAGYLEDGFNLHDLALVLRESIEFAEELGSMSGPAKRELAISFVRKVLAATDGPGPDVLIDPIVESLAPTLIDLVIQASRGGLDVNRGSR